MENFFSQGFTAERFDDVRIDMMFFGVEDKTGKITGLSTKQIHDYNQLLANIANDMVKPQIFIYTEVIHRSRGRLGFGHDTDGGDFPLH